MNQNPWEWHQGMHIWTSFPGMLSTLGEARADCRADLQVCVASCSKDSSELIESRRAIRKLFHELKQEKTGIRSMKVQGTSVLSSPRDGSSTTEVQARSERGPGYLGIYYQTETVEQLTESCCGGQRKWTREGNIKEETFLYILYQAFHSNYHLQRHTKHQKIFFFNRSNRSLYTLGKGDFRKDVHTWSFVETGKRWQGSVLCTKGRHLSEADWRHWGLFWRAIRKTRLQLISYMPSWNLRSLICKMGIYITSDMGLLRELNEIMYIIMCMMSLTG